MKIKETIEEIIGEFSGFDDWMDKYNYLIEMGKSMPVLDEKYKTDSNLISGCQSRVWLHSEYKDGIIHLTADSFSYPEQRITFHDQTNQTLRPCL